MSKKLLSRIIILVAIALLVALFSWEAFSQELAVIGVYSNIPMSDNETTFQDFYLAGEAVAGLKENSLVTAVRKISIHDATGTKSFGDVRIPIAELKVIFAQNQVAVARLHKLISRQTGPLTEDPGVMIGDLIDPTVALPKKGTVKTK